jgi:hypothetical protein
MHSYLPVSVNLYAPIALFPAEENPDTEWIEQSVPGASVDALEKR